ncbi:hypothetical protein Tco_1139123, partial [Tanacetum coccineum]
ETTEATPPAKRAKVGKVVKKRTLKRSQQLVDEFVDEGVQLTEPGFGDLAAYTQRAIEESLKDAHGAPRGPLPPVVFRETDTGKFQPLPEVEGKGKEKVGAEQAAQVLLNLQTPKKKSPTEQYIFQRRTSAPTEPSGHDESSSLYVELGLSDSDTESDEEVPPVVKSSAQDEGQAGPNPGKQDEGQAGPDPGIQDKGQAEPNPDDAYPNVQENLKLTVDELVILEEPARSTGTLSSLQHLAKGFSFGDQFFNDKPSEADNEKTTTDTEVESMVSVTIHQDISAIPPMTSPVIDLVFRPNSPNVHRPLPTTTSVTATTTTILTTIPLPPQPQRLENQDIPNQVSKAMDEIVMDAVDWAMQAPLRKCFRDLPKADMKEILHNRMWESKSYQTHEDHIMLYEALETSMARDNSDQLMSDLAEARKKKKKRQGSPKHHLGLHLILHLLLHHQQGGQSTSTTALSSLKTVALAEYTTWTTTDTRIKQSVSPIPKELHMDDDTIADEQAYSSSGKDVGRDHIPTVNLRQSW